MHDVRSIGNRAPLAPSRLASGQIARSKLLMTAAALAPLVWAAIQDGRYNDQQQRVYREQLQTVVVHRPRRRPRMPNRPQPQPVRPAPGQESVWDYPRPPRLERASRRVRVVLGGQTIADTRHALPTPSPSAPFAALKDYVAFYVRAMDACYVDDELVRPQPGGFYGGWVTDDVVGPFKGEPGTEAW